MSTYFYFGCIILLVIVAMRQVSGIRHYLLYAFGILLPIDNIVGINPGILDVVRYVALLLMLVGRRSDENTERVSKMKVPVLALIIINAGILLKGLSDFDNIYAVSGLTGLLSAVLSYIALSRLGTQDLKAIALGFTSGCAFSGIDIISQAHGGSYFGTQSEWGVRFSGFSFAVTKIGPMLAIAILFLVTAWLWDGVPKSKSALLYRLAALVLTGYSLYLSGSRGGFLATSLLFVLLLAIRFKLAAFIGFALSVAILSVSDKARLMLGTIFMREGVDDISSGRIDLNAEAWAAILKAPVFGPSTSEIQVLNPHTPFLTFGLALGITGVLATGVIFLHGISVGFFAIRRRLPNTTVAGGILISSLIMLLEPTGLLVGLSAILTYLLIIELATRAKMEPVETRATIEPERIAT